ncbi:MAG TPA: MBL fold metallo-hydrolase, partial [Roseiflexaceae bacterium]|nr:MBL fold metallo-hydrolase [Roseiflexaceae bacterium]
QAVFPAPIIATRRCATHLAATESAALLADMAQQDPATYGDVQLTLPTILFDETLLIDGGDLTLELFATPGHADDHIAIWIPQIGTLLPGDAAEAPFPLVDTAATLPQLRDSLARMAALNPAVVLYCHAPTTAGPELLQQNIAYFDELERRCRAALAAGVPAHPAADPEALVGFRFADAIPQGHTVAQPEFYQPAHQKAIRVMLEFLAGGAS